MKQRTALTTIVLGTALAACAGEEPYLQALCDDEPGRICTLAGSALHHEAPDGSLVIETTGKGDGDLALWATFNEPQEVEVAPDGEVWISDFNNYTFRAVRADGTIHRVAGKGRLGNSPPAGETEWPCLEAELNHHPTFMFHDDYVYLASWHNRQIKRIDLTTRMIENVAGNGKQERYSGDGGPMLEATVDLPSGLTVDPEGQVVFMSQADQVIRRLNHDGTIERIAGTCIAGELVDPCEEGEEPVACPGSNKTTCGDPDETCAEFCSPGFGGDGGPALEMRMAQGAGQSTKPGGRLAYDAEGNLIFADRDNNRIRMIDPDGIVHTIAGNGEEGAAGDGGPATEAQLSHPIDIEILVGGGFLFTDTGNSCVRKVDADGIISTVAGRCRAGSLPGKFEDPEEYPYGGDGGPAVDALLNWPYGIDVDGDALYIADSYNQRIRKVNLE